MLINAGADGLYRTKAHEFRSQRVPIQIAEVTITLNEVVWKLNEIYSVVQERNIFSSNTK